MVVSNLLPTFADENRIWKMANGYSQVYGNSINAFYRICRNERTHYSVFVLTPIVLGLGLFWVNEGKKEEKIKNKKR